MQQIDYLNDGVSFVSLVDQMMIDAPLKVVNSGRISYNKSKKVFDESDKKLTTFLWNEEHTSPYRHSYFTFHIKLPIFVARQLMKYQVGSGFRSYEVDGKEVSLEVFDHFYDTDKGCSWNEISGRYTQTSEEFYIPRKLRSNPPHGNKQSSSEYVNPLSSHDINFLGEQEARWAMELACDSALKLYYKLIRNGVAKEIARMVLPQNIFTECYWTVSLQSTIHFLAQRLDPNSQEEIRMLAEAIFTIMEPTLTKVGITKENI